MREGVQRKEQGKVYVEVARLTQNSNDHVAQNDSHEENTADDICAASEGDQRKQTFPQGPFSKHGSGLTNITTQCFCTDFVRKHTHCQRKNRPSTAFSHYTQRNTHIRGRPSGQALPHSWMFSPLSPLYFPSLEYHSLSLNKS